MMAGDGSLALIALFLHALGFLTLAIVAPLRRLGRPAAFVSIACAIGSLVAAVLSWQQHMGGAVSRPASRGSCRSGTRRR